MAEELKHLIEQIQKEGVEKAEEQASDILSKAKDKAAKIVAEAEDKAYQSLLKAKNEAEAFSERSAKSLEQAARDLLITVGQGCEKVITTMLGQHVDNTLSGEILQKMVLAVIEQNPGGALELSVSEADKAALTACCTEQAKQSGVAIELKSDKEVLNGFRVAFKDKNVYLDYTGEAIAEALSSFLRPELAKTVSAVAREQLSKD